jgi:hypothetical protein
VRAVNTKTKFLVPDVFLYISTAFKESIARKETSILILLLPLTNTAKG